MPEEHGVIVRMGHDAYRGAIAFEDDGSLNVATGTPGDSSVHVGPLRVTEGGGAFINDLESSAVPATAINRGGFAHETDGTLYVTSDAPSGAFYHGGIAVRADGAVHVSYGGTVEYYSGGWGLTSTGQVVVGRVDLLESINSFTRASKAWGTGR